MIATEQQASAASGGDVGARAEQLAAEKADRALSYLADLIRIPTDNPPGDCSAASARVASEFDAVGLGVERYEVVPPSGPRVPTVIGWLGPRTMTPDLVLNAHLDTSPQGDGWTVEPQGASRRDGRVYGRGATLSKADVAVYTYAAAAQPRHGEALGTVAVAITADEGSGGDNGPRHLLEDFGLRPKRAICPGITRSVTIAHDGCIQAKITIRGRACHQALVDPATETMRLAVAIAQRIVDAGDALRGRPSDIPGIVCPTLNVTRICGGETFGMAPGRVEVWVDRRVLPSENFDAAADDLRRLFSEFHDQYPAHVECELVQSAAPLRPSPEQAPWARLVQREASAVLGTEVPLGGLPLYTDARWFGAHGIPTVMYGAGAGDLVEAGVNGQDENVAEADVASATQVVARVIAAVLSGQAEGMA